MVRSPTLRAASLFLALTLSAFAATAETREERLAVAEDYVTQSAADMDMAAIIGTMWKPLVDQVSAGGQTVTDSQKERLQALYMQTFEGPMRQLMLDQAPIMADLMTLQEITALRDFYKTPEGRAVMQKLPRLMEAQQPQIMALVEQQLMPILPEIQGILAAP